MREFTPEKIVDIDSAAPPLVRPERDTSEMASRLVLLQAALDQRVQDIIHLNGFLEKREAFLREGLTVFAAFHQKLLDRQDSDRTAHAATVAGRDAAITQLTDEVARRDLAITRLDHDRADRDREIARLHDEVLRRDKTIIDRDAVIKQAAHDQQAAAEANAAAHGQAEQSRIAIQVLNATVFTQEAAIRQLQAAAAQKDDTIHVLSGSIIRMPFSRSVLIAVRWCACRLQRPGERSRRPQHGRNGAGPVI